MPVSWGGGIAFCFLFLTISLTWDSEVHVVHFALHAAPPVHSCIVTQLCLPQTSNKMRILRHQPISKDFSGHCLTVLHGKNRDAQ